MKLSAEIKSQQIFIIIILIILIAFIYLLIYFFIVFNLRIRSRTRSSKYLSPVPSTTRFGSHRVGNRSCDGWPGVGGDKAAFRGLAAELGTNNEAGVEGGRKELSLFSITFIVDVSDSCRVPYKKVRCGWRERPLAGTGWGEYLVICVVVSNYSIRHKLKQIIKRN